MKFSITEKDEWNRFLDIIAISFREDFGKDIPLKITASDDQFISLMYSGSIYLELKMDAMVEEEGELCVQPEMFSVSGRITKEQIDFSTTGNIVKIKQDKHLNKTITVKSREAGYQPKTNQLFPVNMLELKEGIAATSFILSATKNEGNNFDCIRIDPLESGIAFITTDGHRIVKYKSNIISPFNKSLFIARKFIKIVLKLCETSDGKWNTIDNHVIFKQNNTTIALPVPQGYIVNVDEIFNAANDASLFVEVKMKDALEALEGALRLRSIKRESGLKIEGELRDEGMFLRTTENEISTIDKIDVIERSTGNGKFIVSLDYLIAALRNVDFPVVRIAFHNNENLNSKESLGCITINSIDQSLKQIIMQMYR